MEGFNYTGFAWTDRLRQKDPAFVSLLNERREVLDGKLEELLKSGGKADRYIEELSRSFAADEMKWNPPDEGGETESFAENIEPLLRWITRRRNWISENIDDVGRVFFTITCEDGGRVVETGTVRGGTVLDSGPDMPRRDGCFFMGWVSREDGSPYANATVLGDMTFVPRYVKEEEVIRPDRVCFDRYEGWLSLDDDFYYTSLVRVAPEEAQELALETGRWTVSDESVATVNAKGFVYPHAPGDITVTFTLFNGVSASCLLHVYDPDVSQPETASDLTVPQPEMELLPGEEQQLTYRLGPEGRNYDFSMWAEFVSDDPSVAEVDESMGIVTAVSPGKTTVRVAVKSFDYPDLDLTAACQVTVR